MSRYVNGVLVGELLACWFDVVFFFSPSSSSASVPPFDSLCHLLKSTVLPLDGGFGVAADLDGAAWEAGDVDGAWHLGIKVWVHGMLPRTRSAELEDEDELALR